MGSRRVHLLTAVLLLTVPLAGCLGPDDPEPNEGEGDGEEAFGAEIPRWKLGDAWTYTIDTHGFPETESTMMVYEQTANLYRIGSTDEQQALIHSLFNVNPQLGRIQKGNLAVYEDGQPRAMYDFPIEDGDTWRTEFFISQHGGQLTAQATYEEAIQTPIGTFEGFTITAENDAGFHVAYDYIPEIQWFSKLLVEDEDGTQLHLLELQAFEPDSSGTGYFVRGDDLHDATYEGGDCSFPSGCSDQVLVDGASAKGGKYGPYDLVAYNVQVTIDDSNNDRVSISIEDGDGNEVYSRQELTQSQGDEFSFQTVEDFARGDWTIDVQASGNAQVQIRLAGAWSYSGTVE